MEVTCVLPRRPSRTTSGIRVPQVRNPWFKATADVAVKIKICSICRMPELSDKNFRDGLEMKVSSPLGGIQQADGPETAAKSVAPCFTLG